MKPYYTAAAALLLAAVLFNRPAMAQYVNTIERDGLRMHVFVPEPVFFEVASIVLEGEREVALIDAQFGTDDARRVVDLIKSTGKELKTIFISYSDPDYYFGLDHIARQFPQAEIYATPQTVYLINATKDDKTAFWSPQLGANAPQRIVLPETFAGDHFMLENRRIEIKRTTGDEQHSFLWIPSVRTILGGVYLSDAQHLWVADSPTAEDRAKWLAGLGTMKGLNPAYSIPAHFHPAGANLEGDAPIVFTENYLTALESVLAGSGNAAEAIQKMKELYPNLDGESNLEMTAKVLMGEMPWKTVRVFPAVGRKVKVDFGGEYVFELDFRNEREMAFRSLVARDQGRLVTDTVQYTAVEVAPEVYMVYWTEKDKTHVVHIEDYGQGVVYTNISAPDGSFTNMRGTLQLLP